MIRLEVKEPPRARNPAAIRSWDSGAMQLDPAT